jgi:hypothetical protein
LAIPGPPDDSPDRDGVSEGDHFAVATIGGASGQSEGMQEGVHTIIIVIRRNTCKAPVLTDITVSGLSIPHKFRILMS